ncbi:MULTISPECIES: hypothetical protein [Nocardiopsidaceae]|jgi:hypothetical protein|uniref:Chaplin domain-containing protein n=1 Tax=Streptomonospora nanhaiensis TaxID=1323731 RepID=A0ABY6YKQ5_9ACTN|nr:hypothetical protein [Streptomonospora nanhaiensis]WAE72925.1 hypothetical protein OUQ99_27775 [Streptomonospora nanhaiensis]
MLRKITTATAIAGIALGAMLAASPASASGSHGGDQQYNQNLQLVPVQLCNTELAVGLLAGVNVPILSPQTTGDCVNGPISTNID